MMIFLILSSLATTEPAPPVFHAANDELQAYLLEAAEQHPGLEARYEEWLAALERVPQVTSLDDPMFTYGQFLQSETGRFKVMLAQKFPWFGTLRTRGDMAMAKADAALARFHNERNHVFAEVKRAYFEYAFLAHSIRVTKAQVEILAFVEELVRSKYSLGLAAQSDLYRVQTEQTELDDRYQGLLEFRPALSARLAATLGRIPTDAMPWPQEATLPSPPPPAAVVAAQLRSNNPALAELDHLIESSREGIALAKKKGYPNFTLGLEFVSISKPRQIRPERPYPVTLNTLNKYITNMQMNGATALTQLANGLPLTAPTAAAGNPAIDAYVLATRRDPFVTSDGGDDNVMISLQMNVPIWRKKIRSGVQEAKHRESVAKHRKHQRELDLDSAARMAHYRVVDAQRRHAVLDDALIPQVWQTYESVQTAYGSGNANSSFIDLLDTLQSLLNLELEQVRVERDIQVGASELEFLMGEPWTTNAAGAAPTEVEAKTQP